MKSYLNFFLLSFLFTSFLQANDPVKLGAFEAKNPLFVRNKGQIADQEGRTRPDVHFSLHSRGLKLFFTTQGFSYQFVKTSKQVEELEGFPQHSSTKVEIRQVDMRLLGANPRARVKGEGLQKYYENFYLGHCPQGITEVPTYTQIIYEDIYPNIDWIISSTDKGLKYDFLVHPGGNPAQIRWEYLGADQTRLTDSGALEVLTDFGRFGEAAPISFQGQASIATRFVLNKEGIFSYDLDNYDKSQALLIDPNLLWATYYGGTALDEVLRLETGAGSLYVYGVTSSQTGIATSGSFAPLTLGGADAFLMRMDLNGNREWATYFGGASLEIPHDMLFTNFSGGRIYVSGQTASSNMPATPTSNDQLIAMPVCPSPPDPCPDFPTNTYWRSQLRGARSGYLAGFNPAGLLVHSGYVGGQGSTLTSFIALAADNSRLYALGTTNADGMNSGFFGARNAVTSPFVTAYNLGSGTILSPVWSRYIRSDQGSLGTPVGAFAMSFSTDNNRLSITGVITGPGASALALDSLLRPLLGSGVERETTDPTQNAHGFIISLTGSSGVRFRSTYFYSNSSPLTTTSYFPLVLVRNPWDNSLLLGSQRIDSGVVEISRYTPNLIRTWDFRLDTTLFFFGGTSSNKLIRATSTGDFYVAYSTPATRIPQGVASPDMDDIVMGLSKYDASGQLYWTNYFGREGTDKPNALAHDGVNVYVGGSTSSTSGIAFGSNMVQPNYAGSTDGFIAKFNGVANGLIIPDTLFRNVHVCLGSQLRVPIFRLGRVLDSVVNIELSDRFGSFASPLLLGTLAAGDKVAVFNIPLGLTPGTAYRYRFRSPSGSLVYVTAGTAIFANCYTRNPALDTSCLDDVFTVEPASVQSGYVYTWQNGANAGFFTDAYGLTPRVVQMSVTLPGGTQPVMVAPSITYVGLDNNLSLSFAGPSPSYLCGLNDSVVVTVGLASGLSCPNCWVYLVDVGTNQVRDSFMGLPLSRFIRNEGTYAARLALCPKLSNQIKVERVVLNSLIAVSPSDTICGGEQAVLTASAQAANVSFTWLNPSGQTGPSVFITQAGTYTVSVVDALSGCSQQASRVIVSRTPDLDSLFFLPISVSEDTISLSRLVLRTVPSASAGLNLQYSSPFVANIGGNFVFYPRLAGVGSSQIMVRVNQGGCFTERPFSVQVLPAPRVLGLESNYCSSNPADSLVRDTPVYRYSATSGNIVVEANLMEASFGNYGLPISEANPNTDNSYFLFEPAFATGATVPVEVRYRTVISRYDNFGSLISVSDYVVGRAFDTIRIIGNVTVSIVDTGYLYCNRNEFRRIRVSPAGGVLDMVRVDNGQTTASFTANSLGEVFFNPRALEPNQPVNRQYRFVYRFGALGCGGSDSVLVTIPRAPDSNFVFRRTALGANMVAPVRTCVSSTPIVLVPNTGTNVFSSINPNVIGGYFSVNNVAQSVGDTLFRPAGRPTNMRYAVSYTITNEFGCAYTRTDSITVDPLPVVTFPSIAPTTNLCPYDLPRTITFSNAFRDTLRVFRGAMLVNSYTASDPITNPSLSHTVPAVVGNPAASDTLTLRYFAVTEFGCVDSATRRVVVNPRPAVSLASLSPLYCANAATRIPLSPSPLGGAFIIPTYVTGNIDTLRRIYNPAVVTAAGLRDTVIYTYRQPTTGCRDTVRRVVEVTASVGTPNPFSILPPQSICEKDTTILVELAAGTPIDGTFQITGSNRFVSFTNDSSTARTGINPLGDTSLSMGAGPLGQGLVTIAYSYQTGGNPCILTSICSLEIKSIPNVAVIYDVPLNQTANTQTVVCQSTVDLAQLIAYDLRPSFIAADSVFFTGPQVLYDSVAREYFLKLDSVGPQSIGLRYVDVNGCEASINSSINVIQNPFPLIEGVNPFYCLNSAPDTILGIPTGGIWSTSVPDYVEVGPIYSSFYPAGIQGGGLADTIALSYSVLYNNGCRNTTTIDVPVLSRPNVLVTLPRDSQQLCTNQAIFQMEARLDGQITRQGRFMGFGVLPGTDLFNPASDTGWRRLTYTFSDPLTGCQDTSFVNVRINRAPSLDTIQGLNTNICRTSSPIPIRANDVNQTVANYSFQIRQTGNLAQVVSTGGNTADLFVPAPTVFTLHVLAQQPQTGCSDSLNVMVTVLDLPQGVTIAPFDTTLCQFQANPVVLQGFPAGNDTRFRIENMRGDSLFASASNTINLSGRLFDSLGYFRAIYRFQDANGCANADTALYSVHPNPRANYRQLRFCAGDTIEVEDLSTFPIMLNPQDTISTRTWVYQGERVQGQTGRRLFLTDEPPGWGAMQLIVSSAAGCSDTLQSQVLRNGRLGDTIFVYSSPQVAFEEIGGCQNDTLVLVPSGLGLQASFNGASLDRLTSVLWRFGNGDSLRINNPTGTTLNNVAYVYRQSGVYFPSLSVVNQGRCSSTTNLRLVISPTFNPVTMPYAQDFETSNADWFQSLADTAAVWRWGDYQGSRLNVSSKVWSTGLGNPYRDSLGTWLFAPCFDLERSRRPMIKFDYAVDFNSFDGVVLQYYDKAANDWLPLGQPQRGIHWYNNRTNIFGLLGFSSLGQVFSLDGWTGYQRNMRTARYRLDPFRGQRFLRMRFALGTLPGVPNTAEREGFSLDNFWLGERRRRVLVEHFSNAFHPDMDSINQFVYSFLYNRLNGNDAILVQYQTRNENGVDDPLFPSAAPDYAARRLFYGASEATAIVNGNIFQGASLNLRQSDLDTIMLLDPDFSISLEPLDIDVFSGTVGLKAYVQAERDLLVPRPYTLFPIIVEDTLTSNNSMVTSVARKILPQPTGIALPQTWLRNERDSFEYTWQIFDAASYNFGRFQAVVFIQNIDPSKHVHQVITTRDVNYTNPPVRVENVESVEEARPQVFSLRVFPNPAQTYTNLVFDQLLEDEQHRWELFDLQGRLLKQGALASGTENHQIMLHDLPNGHYLIRVVHKTKGHTAQRQISIAR